MGNSNFSRRKFLRVGASATGAAVLGTTDLLAVSQGEHYINAKKEIGHAGGELLYNGIELPAVWPPRDMKPDDYEPMPVPYLRCPPEVIPSGGASAAGGQEIL